MPKTGKKKGLGNSLAISSIIILAFLLLYLFLTKVKLSFGAYLWFFFSIALVVIELTTPFFFALPFGTGSLITVFANLLGFAPLAQAFVFICASAICWVFLYYIVKKTKTSDTLLNGDGIVGSKGVVTTAINPPMKGRVYLAGNTWAAISDSPLEKGQKVTVVSLEGITVSVKGVK